MKAKDETIKITRRLTQERFLHRGNISQLDKPDSNLNYRWNIPVSYVDSADEYKLAWLTVDEDLTLRGYAGKDIWLDPESNTFARFHYGSFERTSEVLTRVKKDNDIQPRLSQI